MAGVRDQWAAGSSYEDFMGRWSRCLAQEFVSWLRIPGSVDWLDVGCGTGALAGVGNLPRRPEGFSSVTSLLALNFMPDPEGAVQEMKSVAAPRATVSACVWDYSDEMRFLRHFWGAAASQDPAAAALDEGTRFPICRRDVLLALFHDSGLRDVRCEPIETRTVFTSFNDYWRPFLGGTGPAPAYVASLGADRRVILARKLEETLQTGPDGTIVLAARAWAVRGTVI